MPRTSFSILSSVAALVGLTLLPPGPAKAGLRASTPDYRYAGVVENSHGIPAHYLKRGEGFVFYFFDAFSQGTKSEPYQLCVGPPGKTAAHCWKRTARYGVGKVSLAFTLPPDVALGELTARWLVAGRTVARWAFFYARSD